MKIEHFERLQPLCPRCRRAAGIDAPLRPAAILRSEPGTILEGVLLCSNEQCLGEYPIIDGVPIILYDLRAHISQNMLPLLVRTDLTGAMEGLLGDCFGPGSAFDVNRQILSTYAFDHYGDLDPEGAADSLTPPGSVLRLAERALERLGERPRGPIIDMGCSVGRTSFSLAEASHDIVLGIDSNPGMLRLAARVLREGVVSYPKRRVGIVFDRREYPVHFDQADKVDFWACDVMDPPFAAGTFNFAMSLNVLDCTASPYEHLKAVARILAPGAGALISTPYDWSTTATPVEQWLGGHSQRSASRGAGEEMLRSLLAGGGHPASIQDLEPVFEIESSPWTVRLHDRSAMQYGVHTIAVRKKDDSRPDIA